MLAMFQDLVRHKVHANAALLNAIRGAGGIGGSASRAAVMHSYGHRAQCATRLRQLGGIPPQMDFVMWLKDRPAPDWPK